MNSTGYMDKLFLKFIRPTYWKIHQNNICTTECRLFWERDRKGGYNQDIQKLSIIEHIRNGWSMLKDEFKLFYKEITVKIENDPILFYKPGVVHKEWCLNKQEHLNNWIVTSDSDHAEGASKCSLVLNGHGCGLFSGFLDSTVPKDGRRKRAGYCSIKSVPLRKSFQRDDYYDWCPYTHLVLRVRGDGRTYMLNIHTPGYFDQLWNDTYHYMLFTRGGPYWQVSKIPFSKFFLSSKGRIQDKQCPIPLGRVTSIGITAADKINGPFSLEIDYIGVESNPVHNEEFAYEMYNVDKNLAGN